MSNALTRRLCGASWSIAWRQRPPPLEDMLAGGGNTARDPDVTVKRNVALRNMDLGKLFREHTLPEFRRAQRGATRKAKRGAPSNDGTDVVSAKARTEHDHHSRLASKHRQRHSSRYRRLPLRLMELLSVSRLPQLLLYNGLLTAALEA